MYKRQKRIGVRVYDDLVAADVAPENAKKIAIEVAGKIGATKKAKKGKDNIELENETLAMLGPGEFERIKNLVAKTVAGEEVDSQILTKHHSGADVAMFGRMLAKVPEFNVEAAVQVAHAFTTNRTAIEDDYFTAVDDINKPEDDAGAGHLGEVEFSSGVYYLYVCVDREQLKANLDGDDAVCEAALKALVEAIATVSPTGKQNTFASRARADYIQIEKGDQQPRTLGNAFTNAVKNDYIVSSIKALEEKQESFNTCYGACFDASETLNVPLQKGSLETLKTFAASP